METWSNLAERWSAVDPLRGDERNAAQQWIAREQTQFTVRWSAEIDTLSPLDRVVFPASALDNSPLSSRAIYDIMAVHEEGRQVKLVILAARRVG